MRYRGFFVQKFLKNNINLKISKFTGVLSNIIMIEE